MTMTQQEGIAAAQRALAQQREDNINNMLARLSHFARQAETIKEAYWLAKDELDQFVKELMSMPASDRPTGEQMAEAIGRDRRRLYQIINLEQGSRGANRTPPR